MKRKVLGRETKKAAPMRAKTKKKISPSAQGSVILNEGDLQFSSEEELFRHFKSGADHFENEFLTKRPKTDFTDQESEKFFNCLDLVLDDPDEVWEDEESLKDEKVHIYIRGFTEEGRKLFYIAVAHVATQSPTFIYLHFPTKFTKVADRYRRGELIFDRVIKEVENGAIDGDSLGEGDDLAVGLYKAMLKLRSETDIAEEKFAEYSDLREETIQEADEIWRAPDYSGQTLVHFIKEHTEFESEESLHYIVVTVEEGASHSHALLFSFPTRDINLVDRYRHGENLQADEVVQEASH